jgi:hypothetical protein
VLVRDHLKWFTNENASSTVIATLPTPSASMMLDFKFSVRTAQYLQIKAPTGVTIRWSNLVSATGGQIQSNNLAAHLTIKNFSATQYEITSLVGTWDAPV